VTAPPEPAQPDALQVAVQLAETPLGQRVAVTITALLGKEAATELAKGIAKAAGALSASGLVVANGNAGAVGEHTS
jgi:hypothetical protein